MNPDAYRILRRLALAGVLIVTIGVVHGLDMAMIVVFLTDGHGDRGLRPLTEGTMLLPTASSDVAPPTDPDNGDDRGTEPITTALRQNYHDAVRLAAREEILADLAEDVVTAQLQADTARFHHCSAHAYAKALDLLLGEDLSVIEDKQKAKKKTRDIDLAPMRCHARRYRVFDPDRP